MNRLLSIPRSFGRFFKEVIHEMKLTEFPSRKDNLKLTYIVIGTTVISGVILLGLDWIFGAVRTYLTTINN